MMEIKRLYELYKECGVITTDSRNVPEGSMFLALKGESFDGNQYAVSALEKGARYAVIDDERIIDEVKSEKRKVKNTDCLSRLILVEDTLQTFKDLAREHRRCFQIPVIGITGTNGKTTTKELIAQVLKEKYNVMYTQGNFNNDVGVPKTLFTLTAEHDIAIVEMGASHPGDIKTLVETAEPTCGLITNVGRAHLQGFGSFEGVKKTKGELYDYLSEEFFCPCRAKRAELERRVKSEEYAHPFVFLNTHDADLCEMAAERGVETEAYVEGRVTRCNPFVEVTTNDGLVLSTQLIGSYNLVNILAAVTVGRHFGVSDEQIKHALESYTPKNNRSQMTVTEHNHLIVDAYNANPTSMAAAIRNFREIEVDKPKFAILGDMRELGEVSAQEHQKIVEMLKESNFDKVWLVGEEFAKTESPFEAFADVTEVLRRLSEEVAKDYYILIKGSNGIKLYQLVDAF